jgi:hypothetical protein
MLFEAEFQLDGDVHDEPEVSTAATSKRTQPVTFGVAFVETL